MASFKSLEFSFGAEYENPSYSQVKHVKSETAFNGEFGWISIGNKILDRKRPADELKWPNLVLGHEATSFRLAASEGLHKITGLIGDNTYHDHITKISTHDGHSVEVESKPFIYVEFELFTKTKDGFIDIIFDSPKNNWIINHLRIEPASSLKGSKKTEYFNYPTDRLKIPDESFSGPNILLSDFLSNPKARVRPTETGLNSLSYIEAIEGSVSFFKTLQDNAGAIIDPIKGHEFQYATPCYAYAAALIGTIRNDPELLESAVKAFDWSSHCLLLRKAASQHEDFYTSPLAHAYSLLSKIVSQEKIELWKETFSKIDPFETYRHPIGGSGGPGSNWNCKSLAGEYLLIKQGLRTSSAYAKISLLAQGRMFNNEYGLYSEGPFVYDIFPRAWLYDVLHEIETEDGIHLGPVLDRGAITSLFIQSPTGGIPAGGRSGQHLWGDALQCLTFEVAADRWNRKGQPIVAGIFKRAARIALRSLAHWKRDSGEYSVVKNNFSPSVGHGFEKYSSHSQYNLLLLTILGYAYEHSLSTESTKETYTPAECGSHTVELPDPFNTFFASSDGTSVQVQKKSYKGQTPRGPVCMQIRGSHPSLILAEGGVSDPQYNLDGLNFGDMVVEATWLKDGSAHSFSNMKHTDIKIKDVKNSNGLIKFTAVYSSPSETSITIEEHYEISNGQIVIDFIIFGDTDESSIRWPVFQSDGKHQSRTVIRENVLETSFNNSRAKYTTDTAGTIELGDEIFVNRSGSVRMARSRITSNNSGRLTIRNGAEN